MIIGLDNISPGLSTSRNGLGGMRHFMQSLITGLPTFGADHKFEFYSPAWADQFQIPPMHNIFCETGLQVPKNRYARAIYTQTRLPYRINQKKLTHWLGTCNTLPLNLNCSTILIVQSTQYFTYPETYSLTRRVFLQLSLRMSLRYADKIVVFSQANKDQLVNWFNICPERISVIYHAFRFENVPSNQHLSNKNSLLPKIHAPYILSVSAFYPYKNLHRLVMAFGKLSNRFGHKLVLAGAPTEFLTEQNLLDTARKFNVENEIVFLGKVTDEQLLELYGNATFLAMPSLEETFGLPVLEAMGLGCPVLTSDRSCMPEIAGPAALLVNPYQVESISEGLRSLLENVEIRKKMIINGLKRSKLFTYEQFFRKLMSVIEQAGHN